MKRTLFWSLFFYGISALGISLTIKAAIGVSSFNSLNVSLSTITGIKVGTITTAINLLFLVTCWFLDHSQESRYQKWINYLIMMAALLFFGNLVNGILYGLLPKLTLPNYLAQVTCFIVGTLISGLATGQVLRLNHLKFPIENFCQLMAVRSRFSFKQYRYSVDVLCVMISIGLSTAFSFPLVVREGTAISLFLLSGAISWSRERSFLFFLKKQSVNDIVQ
ncbi:YczE/YyaS/YitT family protein [Enterococcus gallinarum]|uniref:YczE/YyaS/YitT family protein n=1 Tax=Enterococcus gallinarum TaxID=1353 RepID=UPI001D178E06|nr:hypothetical protein [Enterococcus gallinarum]MCC4044312.1 hypothetical protein [Enterococcus gallinarum]